MTWLFEGREGSRTSGARGFCQEKNRIQRGTPYLINKCISSFIFMNVVKGDRYEHIKPIF